MAVALTSLRPADIKILLADDERIVRRKLEVFVRSRGYMPIIPRAGPSGDRALESAWRERPHVLVLDVLLIGLNAWEVCQYLRSEPGFEDTAIIITGALPRQILERNAAQYGADGYLAKPFDLDAFAALLAKVLEVRCKVRIASTA